jgi:nitrite reductase/ring-hydroxylating ferredoxin subunit
MIQAPLADQFPAYPHSWYLFCTAREIQRRPVSRSMLGGQFVAFRTASGRLALMDGRCGHLGSDLGQGCVKGEAIQCPFHHWEYGPSGQCTHIPATTDIPAWARQACYPVQERHGCVFFFNRPEALYPLPFFDQVSPDELSASRPFGTVLRCPWYMVGANAFDLQHFRAAHDRRLVGLPAVDCPAPFARRATARFAVAGDSLRDRVTRWAAGDEVEMSITDWCGNLMFATATFRRTTSYGLVVTEPLPAGGVWVRVIVFVRKSASWLGRICRDALRLEVRRWFIKKFLSADAPRLDGAHYNPHGLIEADHDLAEYFQWLAHVSHGTPNQQWRSTGLVPTMQPTAPA